MLEIILDKHLLFGLMGVMTALGIASKLIVNLTFRSMIRGAGNMNKSTHPLMRLVKAKFEHACMVSEKVENVGVFVDKYLYEYRVAGMKLHSWRRMEKAAAGACLLLGALGAGLEYAVNGMQDMVLRTGAFGAGLAIIIYLVHLTTDETYRLEAVRNYMVDYLENVCLHRYEKTYPKELKVMPAENPAKAAETDIIPAGEQSPIPEEPLREPTPAEPVQIEEVAEASGEPLKESVPEAVKAQVQEDEIRERLRTAVEKKEEPVPRDVLIRQILEEFMA